MTLGQNAFLFFFFLEIVIVLLLSTQAVMALPISSWVSLPSGFRYPYPLWLGRLGIFRSPYPHQDLGRFLAENRVDVARAGSSRPFHSRTPQLHDRAVVPFVLIPTTQNGLPRQTFLQFKNTLVFAASVLGLRMREFVVLIGKIGFAAFGAVQPQPRTEASNRPLDRRTADFGNLGDGFYGWRCAGFVPVSVSADSQKDHDLVGSESPSDVLTHGSERFGLLARHDFGLHGASFPRVHQEIGYQTGDGTTTTCVVYSPLRARKGA